MTQTRSFNVITIVVAFPRQRLIRSDLIQSTVFSGQVASCSTEDLEANKKRKADAMKELRGEIKGLRDENKELRDEVKRLKAMMEVTNSTKGDK